MNKKLIFISLLIGGITGSSVANAGACDTQFTRKIKQKIAVQATAECNSPNINTSNTVNPQSELVYQNPDAGCDLGLRLPGLSGSGSGISGDSCGILKAITGETVQTINNETQAAVDSAMANVPGGTSTLGTAQNVLNGEITTEDISNASGTVLESTTGTNSLNNIATESIKMN
jgi:hypothetical protein